MKNGQEDKKQKHLDRIQNSVQNMNNLLEDLLILSQAESGKLIFSPEPLEIVEFCQAIIEEIKPIANNKKSPGINHFSRRYFGKLR